MEYVASNSEPLADARGSATQHYGLAALSPLGTPIMRVIVCEKT